MKGSTSTLATVATLAPLVLLSTSGWPHAHPVLLLRSGGTVVATGDMTAIRFDHAAAELPDGRVLVVGGIERNHVMQSSAEVFDPATGRFTPTGSLISPHGWGVTATTLANGKVLVAGGSTGCDAPCYTDAAELYDPRTSSFVATGKMTMPRAEARAVLLATGNVLIVGGAEPNNGVQTAELYDPLSEAFSRGDATHLGDVVQLVPLQDRRVLVVGESGTDLYDPSTGRFTRTGSLNVSRGKFGAAALPDGRVIVAGGQTGGAWGPRLASTEIYDPVSSRFTPGPELTTQRFKLSKGVVSLPNGRVLIAGGAAHPEVYDAASNAFLGVGGATLDGFHFSTATLLHDGRVLLAGGYAMPRGGSGGVKHAWLYVP